MIKIIIDTPSMAEIPYSTKAEIEINEDACIGDAVAAFLEALVIAGYSYETIENIKKTLDLI